MSTTVGKIKYMKMTDSELKALGCTDIEEMISEDFGVPGTDEREAFDREAEAFILAERLKEERRKAGLTQEQLAAKIGTKKSYISRIENGYCEPFSCKDLHLGISRRSVNENGPAAKDIVGDRDEGLAVPAPVLQQGPHLGGHFRGLGGCGCGEVLA